MIAYLSGAISNDPGFREKFEEAEYRLIKQKGWYVLNPARLSENFQGLSEAQYFDMAMTLLKAADIVYMLKDWVLSRGACMEYQYALASDKQIMFENEKDYAGLSG